MRVPCILVGIDLVEIDNSRVEEHSFGKGGFSCSRMREQANIAYFPFVQIFQEKLLPSVIISNPYR